MYRDGIHRTSKHTSTVSQLNADPVCCCQSDPIHANEHAINWNYNTSTKAISNWAYRVENDCW